MKTLKLFLSAICLILFSQTYSQKLTRPQYLSLNNYIDYLNFGAEQLSKEIKCLYDYYGKVERYRKNKKKSYGLNTKALCAGKADNYYYDKTKTESKSLKTADANELNKFLDSIHIQYTLIVDQLRELEIYNRLKDYETDSFKRHDELIRKIQNNFKEYKTRHLKLSDATNQIYRRLQPYNNSNIYYRNLEKMKVFMNEENEKFSDWHLNLYKNSFTGNFPLELIINSINETDTKYYPYGRDTELKHPVSHYYRSFWGSIRSIQRNKRIAIDDYTFKEMEDDSHSNESYRTYLNYLNNTAVINYNSYVKASAEKGSYFLKYARTLPQFKINKIEKNIKAEATIHITVTNFKIKNINSHPKPLNKEKATALNNYVEYINEEIRISLDRASLARGYLKSVKRYKEYSKEKLLNYRPSNFDMTADYRLALSKYHIAVNDSRFIGEEYVKDLNKLCKSIKDICDKRRLLVHNYNSYIFNKGYLKDDFKKADEFSEKFEIIWKEFDKRTNLLYSYLEIIYNSYPPEFPDDPWQKSGNALFIILKEDRKLLHDAKKHYSEGINMSLNGDSVGILARQILTAQYKNMAGLKKIGRHHGHCPYTPYEDIPQDSKQFSVKYLKQKELEKDTVIVSKYLGFIRSYNQIVEDYNKFVWLAYGDYERSKDYKNIYLLQAKREPDIFIKPSETPKIKLITPVDDVKNIHSSMNGYASNNLILLLDVSNSMNKPEKLPLLQNSFKKLLKILRSEDKVAIVIYSGSAVTALESTSCSEKEKIIEIIDNLESGGSTNIVEGIEAAYQTAKENFIIKGNNRILLATDGEFEINEKIKKIVKKNKKDNIYLSVFHYGKNKGKKTELYNLSKTGMGNYEIITQENSDEKLAQEAKAIKIQN